jgi:hypothetical protein
MCHCSKTKAGNGTHHDSFSAGLPEFIKLGLERGIQMASEGGKYRTEKELKNSPKHPSQETEKNATPYART